MRKKRVFDRRVETDPRFNNVVVAKFINAIMERGKKSVAQRVFYDSLQIVEKQTGQNGYDVFQQALNNIKPTLEVRPRRVGGATYQVPMEVRPERRNALAFRWLLTYSRSRVGKPMSEKLAEEIVAASKNEGAAVKKKEDTHKMAEANRAFAHFRW
ncbi:MAG: 30S ribosomal protein S7 [candidate division Zixibacteria bacterium]|nr:30S ribosomal protein S7 [candidate division Zixibacteria bacterium]